MLAVAACCYTSHFTTLNFNFLMCKMEIIFKQLIDITSSLMKAGNAPWVMKHYGKVDKAVGLKEDWESSSNSNPSSLVPPEKVVLMKAFWKLSSTLWTCVPGTNKNRWDWSLKKVFLERYDGPACSLILSLFGAQFLFFLGLAQMNT